MFIRKATAKDIPLIQKLAYETWPHAYGKILPAHQLEYMLELFYSKKSLQEQIEKNRHQFILIADNGAEVGFASFSANDELNQHVHKLHKIYVLPTQQGKGTGQQLLRYVMEESKKNGAHYLQLNVNRLNKAKSFYEKNGFVIHHQEDIDIGHGYFMNDYVMEKKLV